MTDADGQQARRGPSPLGTGSTSASPVSSPCLNLYINISVSISISVNINVSINIIIIIIIGIGIGIGVGIMIIITTTIIDSTHSGQFPQLGASLAKVVEPGFFSGNL